MTESENEQVPMEFSTLPQPGIPVNDRCRILEQDDLRVARVSGIVFHAWRKDDIVAEKLFIVQARQLGVATVDELARALGRSPRTLFHIVHLYAEGGVAALVGERRGRPKGSGVDLLRDAAIRRLHGQGLSARSMAVHLGTSALTVMRAMERMNLTPNVRRWSKNPVLPFTKEEPGLSREALDPGIEEPKPEVVEPMGGAVKAEAVFVNEGTSSEANPDPSEANPDREESADQAVKAPESEEVGLEVAGGTTEQADVPGHEAAERSWDADPLHRDVDRLRAAQGELWDAPPMFASAQGLPNVGLLLAVPHLVQSGVLAEAARLYRKPQPAFYGLRTTLLVLILLSLMRVKRPENLKEHDPFGLGRVVGLDRVPEVKTLRRKLAELAEGPVEELLLALAQRRVQGQEEALAWLYVDGHVRVYHGKEKLPATHVTRMRISMPATQDIWVHDGNLQPVLMVTPEAHPSLATALPPIVEAARKVAGDRRLTLVFDRGGWSPALFERLLGQDIDILTYRKGTIEPVPKESFQSYPRPDEPAWLLHDGRVELRNGLSLRQITRLVGEHQTAIVTSRTEEPADVLAARMFNRWGQENFFKYMRAEYDLDGLVEYGSEPRDPLREVPNPEWTRRNKVLQKARARQKDILARTLDANHEEAKAAAATVEEARLQRDAVARRVTLGALENPSVRLPEKRKRLYDGLKTVAYQIETALANAVAPFYHRSEDEGRTLISAALRSCGNLEVKADELIVSLAPQSSPHRTQAIADLCRLLDATATRFPGSSLRLRYRLDEAVDTRKSAKRSEG